MGFVVMFCKVICLEVIFINFDCDLFLFLFFLELGLLDIEFDSFVFDNKLFIVIVFDLLFFL